MDADELGAAAMPNTCASSSALALAVGAELAPVRDAEADLDAGLEAVVEAGSAAANSFMAEEGAADIDEEAGSVESGSAADVHGVAVWIIEGSSTSSTFAASDEDADAVAVVEGAVDADEDDVIVASVAPNDGLEDAGAAELEDMGASALAATSGASGRKTRVTSLDEGADASVVVLLGAVEFSAAAAAMMGGRLEFGVYEDWYAATLAAWRASAAAALSSSASWSSSSLFLAAT